MHRVCSDDRLLVWGESKKSVNIAMMEEADHQGLNVTGWIPFRTKKRQHVRVVVDSQTALAVVYTHC
jgi:hypothetical protein